MSLLGKIDELRDEIRRVNPEGVAQLDARFDSEYERTETAMRYEGLSDYTTIVIELERIDVRYLEALERLQRGE